jgi:antitoxin (DNA-binding transcriptional repressor) of toxin-antitoxin stability system
MVYMLEAKIHLSRLVEAIGTGAATEVVMARIGRPVARLIALAGPARPRRLGVARCQFTVHESIDAANPLIATKASSVLISQVSLWEIAIKHALARR